MKLRSLISGLPVRLEAGNPEMLIAGIADDSRQVVAGGLFVARAGTQRTASRLRVADEAKWHVLCKRQCFQRRE